jgi:hypothetical protein
MNKENKGSGLLTRLQLLGKFDSINILIQSSKQKKGTFFGTVARTYFQQVPIAQALSQLLFFPKLRNI